MILDSWLALAFLLLAWAAYWAIPGDRARQWLLGLASLAALLVFQGPAGLWLLPLAAVTWWGMKAAKKSPPPHAASPTGGPVGERPTARPLGFWCAVSLALALLAVFKYVNPGARFGLAWLAAPIGLSYFVFHALLALVEARRGQTPRVSGGAFLGCFFFFPTATAGPIKSLRRYLGNLPTSRWPAMADLGAGVSRVLVGLAKKLVLAETLAPLAAGYAHPAQATTLELWIAVYAYALQIYLDFSGYSDLAIGMARLFGLRIEENFDWPYLKTNLRDFWRAWHMSLTGFMREVVYLPLGGSRRGEARLYGNLVLVFVLIGLWHGGEAHFLLWGLYHGVGMAAYRGWQGRLAPRLARGGRPPIGPVVGWLLTFHFVAFGWVLFACGAADSWSVFSALFVRFR